MKENENPVRSVILSKGSSDQITIRRKQDGESYPTHTPVRILVGHTVHLVQKNDVMRMEMAMVFSPEQNWKKCPRCNQPSWAVWMPVPIQLRDVWDGRDDRPRVYTKLTWYILCLHCAGIVAHHTSGPYSAEDIKEFVYDPADDIQMKLWQDPPPQRKRKSGAKKS